MEGKIDPPLTLAQINSADVPGHSNKKTFREGDVTPPRPPPTLVQIDLDKKKSVKFFSET